MHREGRAPSQRFRFEQYFQYLLTQGYSYDYSFLISKKDDAFYHGPGNLLRKIYIGLKAVAIRLRDVVRMNRYDIIFISRRAFLTESMFFEKLFSKSRAKLVFDIDDAVWIDAVSDYNRKFAWLKGKSNTANVCRLSDLVFAGNDYLAQYARQFNPNVVIVPTTIDTDVYRPDYNKDKKVIVIGWSGSFSTIQHFKLALPALKILKEKYKDRITFKVIGDRKYREPELQIQGLPWAEETEVKDLQGMDIGIMPLPDSEWAWGKCGLKGLQYMALEIPTLMSPVGVNKEIIQDGENGFLCNATEEWVNRLSQLIENPDLRERIGKAGRETVVQKYSLKAIQPLYKKYFNELTTV
jgi:glycosyltransferase involved in cell wall biosynthesis